MSDQGKPEPTVYRFRCGGILLLVSRRLDHRWDIRMAEEQGLARVIVNSQRGIRTTGLGEAKMAESDVALSLCADALDRACVGTGMRGHAGSWLERQLEPGEQARTWRLTPDGTETLNGVRLDVEDDRPAETLVAPAAPAEPDEQGKKRRSVDPFADRKDRKQDRRMVVRPGEGGPPVAQ